MPEHRGRKHHQDRVAQTLRDEIGVLIEGELVDPRINLCYVTEVALNPGGKSARVYVAIDSAVQDIVKAKKRPWPAWKPPRATSAMNSRSGWACATSPN